MIIFDDASESRVASTVLAALPDPAVLIDVRSGAVVACNDAACGFYCAAPDALVGTPASELRSSEHRARFLAACDCLRYDPAAPELRRTVSLDEIHVSRGHGARRARTRLRALILHDSPHVLAIIRPVAPTPLPAAPTLMREILAQLPLGLIVADPCSPDQVYTNDAFAQLCCLEACQIHTEAVHERAWRIRRMDGSELSLEELPTTRALREGVTIGPEDLVIEPAHGGPRSIVSAVSAPVRGSDGTPLAAVTAIADVTAYRELERSLREARELAEHTARRKGAFYSSLSRELRSPLTSILGYLDLLADPDCPETERTQWVRLVRRSGESLMALVQDLVDLGQMEAGAFRLQREQFTTSLALAQVLSEACARAQRKGRDLVARYTTPVPRKLSLDAHRFRQALSTLISFVITQTVHDVILQIAVIGTGRDRRLAFDVSGLSADLDQADMDTLFDPFMPASPRARRWSLALPVAKRLAEFMGGSIEHRLDGVRLWMRLTVTPDDTDFDRMADLTLSNGDGAPPSSAPPSRLRGRVLLVEDSADDRLLVAKLLERSGLRVDSVATGHDALDAQLDRYDAVLMDVEMPELDGLETTRRLRAAGVAIPVIALTASALTGDRERCLDAGCTAYVPKPIDRSLLLRTLDGLISTTEDRRRLSILPEELIAVEPLQSTAEDDPSVREILPQFVERMVRYVQHMGRLIDGGDRAGTGKVARSLGATAGSCGFSPLGASALRLADACADAHCSTEELRMLHQQLEEVGRRVRAAYPGARPVPHAPR
jgi:CheY-like chemotaxis protein